jgi:DNA replication protein DnaC
MLARAALTGYYMDPENYRTGHSTSLGDTLELRDPPLYFSKFNSLLEQIPPNEYRKHWDHDLPRRIARINRLVFIDDLTIDPNRPIYEWAARAAFNLLDTMSDMLRTSVTFFFTTNNSFDELQNLLGKQTADRIVELCTAIHCNWKSFRK